MSIICPMCRPGQAELAAIRSQDKLAAWAPDVWQQMPAKYHKGPKFQAPPWLLVVHSGARHDNIAEFFARTGRVRYKGRWVKVNAHVSWGQGADSYVQSVALDTVGKHAGGARFQGHRRLNFCSIGMELPPNPDQRQKRATYAAVVELQRLVPSLTTAVAHRDVDRRKRDPLGYDMEELIPTGLDLPFVGL
jgi:N-acetyl-anhydromuramyl-L-alanine amidase AmpD